MSAVANDVFTNDAYQAPSADLLDRNQVAEKDKLNSHEGRIGVMSFNARFMLGMIIMIAGLCPLMFVGALESEGSVNGFGMAIAAVAGLLGLFFGVRIMIVSAIKRLHDIDMSGWHYFQTMIPIYGTFFFMYMAFRPGKDESNRFGAQRPASKLEFWVGILGIVLTVAVVISGAADTLATVAALSEV